MSTFSTIMRDKWSNWSGKFLAWEKRSEIKDLLLDKLFILKTEEESNEKPEGYKKCYRVCI